MTLHPELQPLLQLRGARDTRRARWRSALRRIAFPALAAVALAIAFRRIYAFRESHNSKIGSQLADDCFRLGIAWPAANLLLGLIVLANLILSPSANIGTGHAANGAHASPALLYCDNRRHMAALAVAAAAAGGAIALLFLHASTSQGDTHAYHRVYWQSVLAFWATALLVHTRDAIRRNIAAFHWSLTLAAMAQATAVTGECYFIFFNGAHLSEPLFGSLHSRFVLAAMAVAAAAALAPLAAHRRGFYRLVSRPCDSAERARARAAAAAAPGYSSSSGDRSEEYDDYVTPLTRVRESDIPLVASSEPHDSVLSSVLFAWVEPTLRLGANVALVGGDLCRMPARYRPLAVWRRFARHYDPKRRLPVILARTFLFTLAIQAASAVARSVLAFGGTFFMQRILRAIRLHASSSAAPQATARLIYLDAIGLLLQSVINTAASNHGVWITQILEIRIRGMLAPMLAARALMRRSRVARPPSDKTAAGDDDTSSTKPAAADTSAAAADDEDDETAATSNGAAINVLTSDVDTVSGLFASLDTFYTLPIRFALGTWYLYQLVGVSAFVGIALSAIYYPLGRMLIRITVRYWRKVRKIEDERITLITELFQGIRAVKLFGWQSRFIEKVRAKRQEELDMTWKIRMIQTPVSLVQSMIYWLILASVLATYSLVFGHELTADILYPTITVFSTVNGSISNAVHLFNWASRAYISIKRVEGFMTKAMVQPLDERVCPEETASEDASCRHANNDGVIGFSSACFDWSLKTDVLTAPEPTAPYPAVSDEQTPLLLAPPPDSSASSAMLSIDGMSTANASSMVAFSLKDISLRFPLGGLSIIVGPTGSGKSSLLAALIGEMTLTSGCVMLPTANALALDAELAGGCYSEIIRLSGNDRVMRDIAYVAQEAWLRNATIRDNILFGEPYDQQRYEEVLRVCALKPDLRILDAGDKAEIGERGVTLSGGQKQRVALARAVYSSRRILLIDDCLSAVDAHTGKHILTECLLGQTPLMHGRTRVLVTHHVSACMPHANYMAVMQEGCITASGTPDAVHKQLGGLSREIQELELTAANDKQQQSHSNVDSSDGSDGEISEPSAEQKGSSAALANVNDLRSEDDYTAERLAALAQQRGIDPSAADLADLEDTLVEDEEREQGYVPPRVWFDFMRMCGSPWYWALVVLALLFDNATSIMQSYWLRLWMNADNDPSSPASRSVVYWLSTYLLAGLVSRVFGQSSMVVGLVGSLRASRLYHENLFVRVVNATPRFFDKTPIGRVISRFSRDMDTIDSNLIADIMLLAGQLVHIASTIFIVSAVVPPFILIALLMIVAYVRLAAFYMGATRELKRLNSISTSPLLSLISEMVTGVESIRAFGAQNQYVMETMNRVDECSRPRYLLDAANRWLSVRTSLAGSTVSFATTVMILMNLDRIDAGLAGFMLMYAISFSSSLMWFLRCYCECEISMSSVERVNQYLQLEQEAASHSAPENKPPADWPATGRVEVGDLVVEYVPGKPVIRGVSFSTAHGEKIGVVGRTGAGKSTLSLAFLRFIEAAKGRILLDNVDISGIGLEDLRRNITIIPQDPTLFNGTIRFNLDPFSEFPDELLWDALRRSHLVHESSDNSVSSSGTASPAAEEEEEEEEECGAATRSPTQGPVRDGGVARMSGIFKSLDAEIKENGQNLSLGQRQLVALARALVRRSRLIIMDEATASVDFDTDERIQRTIRGSEFADSTLFCIAHRLRTIIDYDRVLVMDKGQVAEFDTPWNLLQNKNSIFRGMCEKTGEFKHLYSLARPKMASPDSTEPPPLL